MANPIDSNKGNVPPQGAVPGSELSEPEFVPLDKTWVDLSPTPEEQMLQAEFDNSLRDSLAQLRPRRRFVLNRRFWEGQTMAEISREMGISTGRVREISGTAIRHLQRTMRYPELRETGWDEGLSDTGIAGDSDSLFPDSGVFGVEFERMVKDYYVGKISREKVAKKLSLFPPEIRWSLFVILPDGLQIIDPVVQLATINLLEVLILVLPEEWRLSLVEKIVPGLHADNHWSVRQAAIKALDRTVSALPADLQNRFVEKITRITGRWKQDDPFVVGAAGKFLARRGLKVVSPTKVYTLPEILEALENPDPAVRRNSLHAIADHTEESVFQESADVLAEKIVERLRDGNKATRKAAVKALREISPLISEKTVNRLARKIVGWTKDANVPVFRVVGEALKILLPLLSSKKRRPFVEKMAAQMENKKWSMRNSAVETVGDLLSFLPEGERRPFVEKIGDRLEDKSGWSIFQTAVGVLKKELPGTVPIEERVPFVEKIFQRVFNAKEDRYWRGSGTALWALEEMLPLILEEERCLFTERLVLLLEDEHWRKYGSDGWSMRYQVVKTLGRIVPLLPEAERQRFVEKIAEQLGDENKHVRLEALRALKISLPSVPAGNRVPFLEKIVTCFLDKESYVSRKAVVVLKDILPVINVAERREFASKMVERMVHESWGMRWSAVWALAECFPFLPERERRPFAEKIIARLEEPAGQVRVAAVRALQYCSIFLSIRDRLSLLALIQESVSLDNSATFNAVFSGASVIFESIPLKVHRDFVKKYQTKLKRPEWRLYFYLYLGGPDIIEIWQQFNKETDPEGFLQDLKQRARAHRYGRDIRDLENNDEHLLAYVALDNPSRLQDNFGNPRLTWPHFVTMVQKSAEQELSPPFLKQGFSFQLNRQVMVQETVDKGVLNDAIALFNEGSDLDEVRKWFLDICISPPKAVKTELRKYLIKQFGFDEDVDLTRQAMQETIREALAKDEKLFGMMKALAPYFAAASENGDVPADKIFGKIILTLMHHRHGLEGVRGILSAYQAAVKSGKIPSELVVQTLNQLVLLYADLTGEVLSELGIQNIPRAIVKIGERLEEQMKNMVSQETDEATFELIPSKTRADLFFGYVGEDCTKNQGSELLKPDFQVYRIIVDGQLEGMVYVHSDEHVGKKALTLAVAPRERLNVDQKALLQKLERGFGVIAKDAGYDYVLLSARRNEQGNRVDMLTAIKDMRYDTVNFQNSKSALFRFWHYYIIYDRSKPMSSTDDITFLTLQPDTQEWIPAKTRGNIDPNIIGGKGDADYPDPEVEWSEKNPEALPEVIDQKVARDDNNNDPQASFDGAMTIDGISNFQIYSGSEVLQQEADFVVGTAEVFDDAGAQLKLEANFQEGSAEDIEAIILAALESSDASGLTEISDYLNLAGLDEVAVLMTDQTELYRNLIDADLGILVAQLSQADVILTQEQIIQLNAAIHVNAPAELMTLLETIIPADVLSPMGLLPTVLAPTSNSVLRSMPVLRVVK